MYHPSKFRKDYTSIDFDKAVTGHPLEKKRKLICAKILNFYRHSKPTKRQSLQAQIKYHR